MVDVMIEGGAKSAGRSLLGRVVPTRATYRGWLLCLPAIALALLLLAVPIFLVVINGLSASGIRALKALMGGPGFSQVLVNTAIWTAISVGGSLVVGYGAALLLQHRSVRAPGLWRSLLLLPWITPAVASAQAWRWFYDGQFGYLNEILRRLELIHGPLYWLLNGSLALPAVSLIQAWGTFPFVMMLVSAALQAIPADLYEAARLDGASYWKTFRFVVLPSLRDVTFILSLITTVWAINSFVFVWVITSGGPAGDTTTLPVQIYSSFQAGDYPTVYLVALFEFVVTMFLAGAYIHRSRTLETR